MLRSLVAGYVRRLLPVPTAPYGEDLVAAEIRALCAEASRRSRHGPWRVRADAAGNLVVRVPGAAGGRPALAFQAHMDHPAFLGEGPADRRGRLPAAFYGGHPPERLPGGAVRVTPLAGGAAARARVREAGPKDPKTGRVPAVLELADGPPPDGPWIATWDLPLRLTATRVQNAVCDNLASCATILAGLDLAARQGLPRPVLAYFTRCEENGFVGCLEGIRLGTFPRTVPVLTLECSPRLTPDQPGKGPIVRVGDRMSIYDPGVVAGLEDAARTLARRVPGFAWQRKLMDGGACEATAFCAHGYRAAGLAVALAGYHNVPDDRRRRGQVPEAIHRRDQENLVLWVSTLALSGRAPAPEDGARRSLEGLRRHRARLLRSRPGGAG